MRESFGFLRTACRRVVVAIGLSASALAAQGAPRLDLGGMVETGGELERYLRVLQIGGQLPLRTWAIHPFSGREAAALRPVGDHPWSARVQDLSADTSRFRWLRTDARATLNTMYAFRDMEGPAWQGRGLTAQVQGGFAGRRGRLRYQLAPLVFLSQNAAFDLSPGPYPFQNSRKQGIDYPERFGNRTYGRIDLGASAVEYDFDHVYLALSNEAQRWGTGRSYAMTLGPNPGGFLHLALGTAHPVQTPIGSFHARYLVGSLDQTAFSPPARSSHRYAVAWVLEATPRGIDGLELGLIRWQELLWTTPLSLQKLARPFTSGFNRIGGTDVGNINIPDENGMVSGFFRWTLPRSGFEVFGEIYREDYAGDLRTLLEKPDDLTNYTFGMQYAYRRSPERIRILRLEWVNGQLGHQERGQRGFFFDEPPYVHSEVTQGHTQRGLLLGAADAFGGAGLRWAVEEYDREGRWSVAFQRAMQAERVPGVVADSLPSRPADVIYSLRFERMRFAGDRDYTVTVIPAYNLNRYTLAGNDRFNLYVSVGMRGWR